MILLDLITQASLSVGLIVWALVMILSALIRRFPAPKRAQGGRWASGGYVRAPGPSAGPHGPFSGPQEADALQRAFGEFRTSGTIVPFGDVSPTRPAPRKPAQPVKCPSCGGTSRGPDCDFCGNPLAQVIPFPESAGAITPDEARTMLDLPGPAVPAGSKPQDENGSTRWDPSVFDWRQARDFVSPAAFNQFAATLQGTGKASLEIERAGTMGPFCVVPGEIFNVTLEDVRKRPGKPPPIGKSAPRLQVVASRRPGPLRPRPIIK